MNKPQNISNRVEEVLNSLDGIQKGDPNPYFFTRLKARLERNEKSLFEKMGVFMARPAVAISGLCLVLALNAFILIQKDNTSETSGGQVATSGRQMQMPEEDYILAVASSYDYENLEP